jgi:membrane associated rhomboid family serine protease
MEEVPKVTLLLASVNVAFFVFLLFSPDLLLRSLLQVFTYGPSNYFMFFAPATSQFLHVSVLSLVFSTIFLLLFGPIVEARAGFLKFVTVYVLAGFTGSALEMGTRLLMHGADVPGAAGASGAISGIAAFMVYRMWYSRSRVTLDPPFLKMDFSLPAAPFVILWFLMDLLLGTQSMEGHAVSSGHIAQVGGFLTGLLLAKAMGYGHEAKLELHRKKVMEKFDASGDWEKAVSLLKKMAEDAPDDAGLNLDLARLHARQKKKKGAVLYYRRAVEGYFKEDLLKAAKTIFEHLETLKMPMAIQVHLKVAKKLVERGLKKDAKKVMLLALRRKAESTPPYEQAIVFYVLLLLDLGEKKEAKRAYGIFIQRFPDSDQKKSIMQSVKRPPGSIFPVKEGADAQEASLVSEENVKVPMRFGPMSMAVAVDPWLLPTWFIMFSVLAALGMAGVLPGAAVMGLSGLLWQVLILLLSILITAERKFALSKMLASYIKEMKAKRAAAQDSEEDAEDAEDEEDDNEDDTDELDVTPEDDLK